MRTHGRKHVGPLCIHASYLINVCAQSEEVRLNSVAAFRASGARAGAGRGVSGAASGELGGMTRDEGITLAARSIEEAIAGWLGREQIQILMRYGGRGVFAGWQL